MRQLRPGIGIQTSRNGVHHRQLGNIRQRSSGGQLYSHIICTGRTQTIAINRALGSWILNAKEIKRIATGLNA